MAVLIVGSTQCPLCGEVMSAGQSTVASPHFIEDPSHPLWRCSDAAMHGECFQRWAHRQAFVDEYNRTIGTVVWGNGTQHRMHPDGTITTTPAASSGPAPGDKE